MDQTIASNDAANVYQFGANRLQILSTLSPAEKIFKEAIEEVQKGTTLKAFTTEEIDKVTSVKNLESLRASLDANRDKSRALGKEARQSTIWTATKAIVNTITRFKDPIAIFAQMGNALCFPSLLPLPLTLFCATDTKAVTPFAGAVCAIALVSISVT